MKMFGCLRRKERRSLYGDNGDGRNDVEELREIKISLKKLLELLKKNDFKKEPEK